MSNDNANATPEPAPAGWKTWLIEHLAKALPKNWQQILAWLIVATISTLLAKLGLSPTPTPPAPTPEWEAHPTHGWVEDPDAVNIVCSQLAFKAFADTPAGRSADPLPDHVYLWDAYRKKLGTLPAAKNQGQIGSCVAFGTNTAICRTLMASIVNGANVDFKDIAEEVTYGGSRVQVGGGKIRGDGSVGAWGAQFVQKWGVISREKHGAFDLGAYSESRCRSWGQSGVPAGLLPVAKEHPVKDITLVKTWPEAKKALASGYGIAVCSDQGFVTQRDTNGVARASGSWAHCMCLDGYQIEGGKEYGHIENSWGPDAHTGPVGWGNPSTAGFWAESAVIDRMLRQGDSWAFSHVVGFPSRKLDWFVRDEPRRRDPFAQLACHWEAVPCDTFMAF